MAKTKTSLPTAQTKAEMMCDLLKRQRRQREKGTKPRSNDLKTRIKKSTEDANFLRSVVEEAQKSITDAETLPHLGWQSRTWAFVRAMKANEKLAGLSAEEAHDQIPWQRTDFDEQDRFRFVQEWDRVHVLPGKEHPLEQAFSLALEKPLFEDDRFPNYGKFLSVAAWLQRMNDDSNIFLPVRLLGEIMGLHPATISNYRAHAERQGFLRKTEPHSRARATRYRFDLKRLESER